MGVSASTATRNDDDGPGPGIPDVEPASKRSAMMGRTTETKWGWGNGGEYTTDHINKGTSEGRRKRNVERMRQTNRQPDRTMRWISHVLQVPWRE
jgi:hypothetical protein